MLHLADLLHLTRTSTAAPAAILEPIMPAVITGTATLDKTAYNVGEVMTLTVVRSATATVPEQETVTTVLTAPDGATETVTAGPVTVTKTVAVATTIAAPTDTDGRTWVAGTDDGKTAVFTATA